MYESKCIMMKRMNKNKMNFLQEAIKWKIALKAKNIKPTKCQSNTHQNVSFLQISCISFYMKNRFFFCFSYIKKQFLADILLIAFALNCELFTNLKTALKFMVMNEFRWKTILERVFVNKLCRYEHKNDFPLVLYITQLLIQGNLRK